MPRNSDETRNKILNAASRLFYTEGLRAVSVDTVAEAAGVTKKTLYYHYRSKDDLIAAYIASRDNPTLDAFDDWYAASEGDVAERIGAVFRKFADAAASPKWRGCGFMRAVAELANMPGHPAIAAGVAHKKRFEQWIAAQLEASAIADPADLAREIAILFEGAAATMLMHRDSAYIETAGAMAVDLIRRADPDGKIDPGNP